MATKKTVKVEERAAFSWKQLFIAGSFALNLAVLALFIAMMATSTLDGMFIKKGLEGYCDPNNDKLFAGSTEQTKAVRDFTCAQGQAKPYYDAGIKKYLNDYRIPHTTPPNEN